MLSRGLATSQRALLKPSHALIPTNAACTRLSERRWYSAASSASPASSSSSSAPTKASSSKVQTQASTKSSAKAKANDSDELPPLSRPLGVAEPPSTIKKTWREGVLELMDQDVRMERRRHLVKEATKGYYGDLHAVRRHGGKTWIAPKTLIREDLALYFPNMTGAPLDGSSKEVHTADLCKDKIAVVSILSSVMSEEHVNSFLSDFPTHPSFLLLRINLQQNPLHSLLLSLSLSSLRRSVPKHLHSSYMLSSTNMEYLREPMGMDNKHVGYVYLVDQNGKVRWAGGGLGTEEEKESLRGCVEVLLGRLEKGESGGSNADPDS